MEVAGLLGLEPNDLSDAELYWGDNGQEFQGFICQRISSIVNAKSVAYFMLDESTEDDDEALDNAVANIERLRTSCASLSPAN